MKAAEADQRARALLERSVWSPHRSTPCPATVRRQQQRRGNRPAPRPAAQLYAARRGRLPPRDPEWSDEVLEVVRRLAVEMGPHHHHLTHQLRFAKEKGGIAFIYLSTETVTEEARRRTFSPAPDIRDRTGFLQ